MKGRCIVTGSQVPIIAVINPFSFCFLGELFVPIRLLRGQSDISCRTESCQGGKTYTHTETGLFTFTYTGSIGAHFNNPRDLIHKWAVSNKNRSISELNRSLSVFLSALVPLYNSEVLGASCMKVYPVNDLNLILKQT